MSLFFALLSRCCVFTLCKRLWVLHFSALWERSWQHYCTGQLLSSWNVFSQHLQVKPPLLCRSLHQKQPWNGKEGCLWENRDKVTFCGHVKVIRFCRDLLVLAPHLSLGRTSGWVLWLCHRSPALHSLQWRYVWCLACSLEEESTGLWCWNQWRELVSWSLKREMNVKYLSKGPGRLHLLLSSCKHQEFHCTSSRRQPIVPVLGNAPSPHPLVVQKPRPLPLWCSLPWAEWRSQHLCTMVVLVTMTPPK